MENKLVIIYVHLISGFYLSVNSIADSVFSVILVESDKYCTCLSISWSCQATMFFPFSRCWATRLMERCFQSTLAGKHHPLAISMTRSTVFLFYFYVRHKCKKVAHYLDVCIAQASSTFITVYICTYCIMLHCDDGQVMMITLHNQGHYNIQGSWCPHWSSSSWSHIWSSPQPCC